MEYEFLIKRMIDKTYQLDSTTILRCFWGKVQIFLVGVPADIANYAERTVFYQRHLRNRRENFLGGLSLQSTNRMYVQ